MARPVIDLTGKRFGSWTVLYRYSEHSKSWPHIPYWVCRCDCGFTDVVLGSNLRYGKSTACRRCRSDKMTEGVKAYHRQNRMAKAGTIVYD